MECRNRLDALLQLFQTRLDTLHLGRRGHDNTSYVSFMQSDNRHQNGFIISNPFTKSIHQSISCLLINSTPINKSVLFLTITLPDCFSYLTSIQVVCDLKDQEEDPQGLLLDRVSLPVFHNSSTQCEQRVHLTKLPFHEQQLEDINKTVVQLLQLFYTYSKFVEQKISKTQQKHLFHVGK